MQEKTDRNFNICKDLNNILNNLLEALKNDYDSPKQWKVFYQFVAKAYNVKKEERPSVSKFATILQNAGIVQPGSWAVLYAHCLYSIATYEGSVIYNEFNP